MELRHLRYFIGVTEEENVSRAALETNLTFARARAFGDWCCLV
jgi:DNA-binding transcriptional LysR family regulator